MLRQKDPQRIHLPQQATGKSSGVIAMVMILLDPLAQSANTSLDATLRIALANAIQGVFALAFAAAAIGLVATALAPAGRIAQLAAQQAQKSEEGAGKPITTVE